MSQPPQFPKNSIDTSARDAPPQHQGPVHVPKLGELDDSGIPFRPIFLDPERAEKAQYVGVDTVPTFDDELPLSPALPEHGLEPVPANAPSPGYISRYREIARLHAIGKTNNEICRILGYTPVRMSIILKDPFIQSEIARCRAKLFDQDVVDKIKEASKDGARLVHEIILNESEKTSVRLDAAKWAAEKAHGKARQEITVESGTLTSFMELLRDMTDRGEMLDVTPVQQSASPQVSGEIATKQPPESKFNKLAEDI